MVDLLMDLAKVRPFFLTQLQKLHSQPVYHYPEKKIHNIQLPHRNRILHLGYLMPVLN